MTSLQLDRPGQLFHRLVLSNLIGSNSTDSATGKGSGATLSSLHQTTIIILFFCTLINLDVTMTTCNTGFPITQHDIVPRTACTFYSDSLWVQKHLRHSTFPKRITKNRFNWAQNLSCSGSGTPVAIREG